MSYKKFAFMLFISCIIMYVVMFLNVYSVDHLFISALRFYMTLLMVAPMAIVMMLMMGKMYKNKNWNTAIILSAVIVFIVSLIFLRKQTFIGDIQYMKAMIPHHSSAILTSEYAGIQDPEVKKLSEQIIETQKKEIAQMKEMIKRLENK